MAKATEKPAFNVADTDKRNDKRILVDYQVATAFAPELVELFDPFLDGIETAHAAIAENENALPITSAVDTVIEQQKALILKRYRGEVDEAGDVVTPGEYVGYTMRGGGEKFFLPKGERRSTAQKAEDLINGASDEQLEAIKALLAARGV